MKRFLYILSILLSLLALDAKLHAQSLSVQGNALEVTFMKIFQNIASDIEQSSVLNETLINFVSEYENDSLGIIQDDDCEHHTVINDEICQGDIYDANGFYITNPSAGIPVYYDTLTASDGCDSIITLNLTVHPTYLDTVTEKSCVGDADSPPVSPELLLGDYIIQSDGAIIDFFIPDTLSTIHGCDSIIIRHILVYPTVNELIPAEICQYQNYNDNGFDTTINTPGYYEIKRTDTTIYGCDSIITLALTVHPAYRDTVYDTMCINEGPYYDKYGFYELIDNSGTFEFYRNEPIEYGCDSSIRVYLTVHPVYNIEIFDEICQYQNYNDNGFDTTINQSGTFNIVHNYKTTNGCDSIITLNLTVHPVYNDTVYDTICQSEAPYSKHGFTGISITNPGTNTITDSLTTVNACDSIVTLILTVHPVYNDTVYGTICENEQPAEPGFDTVTITGAGDTVIVHNYQTIQGCDSTVTLILTVKPIYNTVFDEVVCQSDNPYSIHGFTNISINEPDTITLIDTVPATNGCDSIITLVLTVHPVYNDTVYDTICQSEVPYSGHGFIGISITNPGTNTITDSLTTVNTCDSIVTLILTVHPVYNDTVYGTICENEQPAEPGFDTVTITGAGDTVIVHNYQTIQGCDSTVTLILTVKPIYHTVFNEVVCQSDNPYSIHGFTNIPINEPDTITLIDTVPATNGCDSIITLNLTVHPVYNDTVYDTACQSALLYSGHGFTGISITNPGTNTITDSLTTVNACDSIVTLILTVHPVYNDTVYDTICFFEQHYTGYGFDTIIYNPGLTILTDSLTTVHGCDSITTVKLTVTPIHDTTIHDTVCQYDIYNKNGFNIGVVTTAGSEIPFVKYDTATCHVTVLLLYVYPVYNDTIYDTVCIRAGDRYQENNFDTLINQFGSFELIHNDTTQYGCDSITTLYLIAYPLYNDTIYDTICFFEQHYTGYGFDTIIYTSGLTILTDSLTTVHGCDSITTVKLTVTPIKDTVIYDTVCQYDIYNKNGFNIGVVTTAGSEIPFVKYDTATCHVTVLLLYAYPVYNDTIYADICLNETYNKFNFDVTPVDTGIIIPPSQSYPSVNGCDSIVTLHLTVHPVYNNTIYDAICILQGDRYQENNFDTLINQSGTFELIHNDTTKYGCDSITTLFLEVNFLYNDTIYDTVCQSDLPYSGHGFSGISISNAGIVTEPDSLTAINGCDSITTLVLTVHPVYNDTIYDTICQYDKYNKYNFDTTINISGQSELYHYDTTANGCDSTTRIILQVHPVYNDTIYDTVCIKLGDRYQENNFDTLINQSGTFELKHNDTTKYGCDSITILLLEVNLLWIDTVKDTICQHQPYNNYGFNIVDVTASGDTVIINHDTVNCHKRYLLLHVYPVYDTLITDTICFGGSYSNLTYTFLNMTPTAPGTINIDTTLQTTPVGSYSCDSIIRLRLTVLPSYDITITDTICFGDNYQNLTYGFLNTTPTAPGTVNIDTTLYTVLGGCDSIVRLRLTVLPVYDTLIIDTICLGDTYINPFYHLLDTIPTASGTVNIDTTLYTVLGGCDSIVRLRLTVLPVYDTLIIDTICFGDHYDNPTYNFLDTTPAAPGTVNIDTTLYTVLGGCDSIIRLELTVLPVYNILIMDTICLGEDYDNPIYNFLDTTPTASGTVNIDTTLYTVLGGCDSIVRLRLTVNQVYNDTIYDEICQYERYNKYNFNIIPSEAGIITPSQHLKTVNDCDSIVTLHLTVHPVYLNVEIRDTICQYDTYNRYNFNIIMNQEGDFVLVSNDKTQYGCDSITTVYLRVNPVYEYTIQAAICLDDSYNLNGFDVTPSVTGISTYTLNLFTIKGCDSIINLQLTVNPSYNLFIVDTIYEDEWSYVGSAKYNTPGIHVTDFETEFGCDSIVSLDLYVIYYPPEITAFSPFNKDGINDYLYPGFKVQIFNRYGVIIYETKTKEEQDLGWDGRNMKGQQVEPGLYFYILYNSTGKPRIKSSVEVLKLN
ncbi:MAG: gliding motility-associated C-terminal domain-containing protein [Prevotellaceae bacterium]|jgi:hypothetical protein|nr:gliding motility-associated C-terminal domain-containing protein [Prevotellaceae bacterium]